MQDVIVLKHHKNFADNLSTLAYGKILENRGNSHCCWENTLINTPFEEKMKNFNILCEYISKSRISSLNKKHFFRKANLDDSDLKKVIKKKYKVKNKIISKAQFDIEDIELIPNNLYKMYDFSNLDFICNYDILEDITESNSIGIYLDKNDFNIPEDCISFIKKSLIRLNKYLKNPKLYIFCSAKFDVDFNEIIKTKYIKLHDWREEFYFLMNCKNIIIPQLENSYSYNLWASILNKYEEKKIVYPAELNIKKHPKNWLEV